MCPGAIQTVAKGTMSCAGGAGSPRFGTYPPRRAAHDTAPTVASRAAALLPAAGWGRCQGMTGNSFGTDVCHLGPLYSGDI
jgi:hypothetical protein